MVVRDDGIEALRRCRLFNGLGGAELARILDEADECVFLEDHRVLTEGRLGAELFVIVSGFAEVLVDGERVAILEKGDFFGEMAVIDGGPRTATVRAITQVRCLSLPNGLARRLVDGSPAVAANLVDALVERLRQAATTRSAA